MHLTIHRGSKEIGGTLIELKTETTRILIDAGYPLFLNNAPIEDNIANLPPTELLNLGVLPKIKGLYSWDSPDFNAVVISHAHIDHYGLLKYINPAIPVYMSKGTEKLIQISQRFHICDCFDLDIRNFSMHKQIQIGDMRIKPHLMDHSAFDAAAFEITNEDKTIVYSGDFRGHGRKSKCLDYFIQTVKKHPEILLIEGSMLGRLDEQMMTESEIEAAIVERMGSRKGPLLFQCSSQNIDRLVSFYRAALRLNRKFVVDVYTANILHELRKLGNNLPYPSPEYPNIKVFFPFKLTRKIFNDIGEEYALRFTDYYISRDRLKTDQESLVMGSRPSMRVDIEKCGLHDGVFLYSLWKGYRNESNQQSFEKSLEERGFSLEALHTSGHASVIDIKRVINSLDPQKVVPIHTLHPGAFCEFSDRTELQEDGVAFEV
ncbi:MBL fold metallo-hydrolase [Dehalogenimonas sp. THU2]|uniref:MBL fold metallo-hydrolase n=1 Tax=Dehalogenimonas sp. THU2 TaxID=3151121 RepID=UPI0032187D9E